MICELHITRYPKYKGVFGFFSMAIFRLILFFNKKISFYKLLGSGKNGSFSIIPDFNQWVVLLIRNEKIKNENIVPAFFILYWKFFKAETITYVLEPIEGYGKWDTKNCFGNLSKQNDYDGLIAILTRATIRINKLKNFWKHVDSVASQMKNAKGYITSYGIGEMPFIKQATFSIWENKDCMKAFAYGLKEHQIVIQKTRKENWYSEEMFVRFKILQCYGCINGNNPLQKYL